MAGGWISAYPKRGLTLVVKGVYTEFLRWEHGSRRTSLRTTRRSIGPSSGICELNLMFKGAHGRVLAARIYEQR